MNNKTPPSRSWILAGCTIACNTNPKVSTKTWRFFPLTRLPRQSLLDQSASPFFGTLYTLTVNDAGGRRKSPLRLVPTSHIECTMDAPERPLCLPARKVIKDRTAGWELFGNRAPLTPGTQAIPQSIKHFPDIHCRFRPPRRALCPAGGLAAYAPAVAHVSGGMATRPVCLAPRNHRVVFQWIIQACDSRLVPPKAWHTRAPLSSPACGSIKSSFWITIDIGDLSLTSRS